MLLSDAIAAFNVDRMHQGIAEGTRKNDARCLNYLLTDVGNVNTRNLRPQHMDVFWSRRTTWGPGAMNNGYVTLSVFFGWCQSRGYMSRNMNLLERRRKNKVPPRDRIIIPQGEFSTFLDGIQDPRARITCALGLYLFTRISETEGLRWQDVDTLSAAPTVEVFRKKTQTLDTLPLCEELLYELKRWRLAYAARVGSQPEPGWFVVPGQTNARQYGVKGTKGFGGSFTPQWLVDKRPDLGRPIRTALENAGYYLPQEGGHTLRRSGATALYNQLSSVGHDRAIRICQAMLGHSNIATTEVYLRLDLDRKVRNDLLAGKPMFPTEEAVVIQLGQQGVVDGQEDLGGIRV